MAPIPAPCLLRLRAWLLDQRPGGAGRPAKQPKRRSPTAEAAAALTAHRPTERAARAGLHVLCEKPMAVTAEDCEQMIAVTRRNGVKLMIAYRLHFWRANLEAAAMAHAGTPGAQRFGRRSAAAA